MDEQRAQQILDFFERWGANTEEADGIYKKSNKSAKQFQKEIDELTKSSKKQKATYADFKKTIDELDDAIEELSNSTDKASEAENQAKKVVLQKMKADIAAEAATKALGEASRKAAGDMIGGAAKGTAQFVKNLQADASGTAIATDLMTAGIDIAAGAAKGVGKGLNALGDAAMAAGVATEGLGFVVGGAMKVLGTVIDSGSEVAAKVAKFGVEILSKEVEKTYKAFNQMSASGALFVDGMQGMRDASAGAGLTVEQMSNIVKANSAKMAEAGIGVGAATKMFGKVADSMKKSGVQEQLLKLGFGFEEQVSLMADVTKRLRQSGKNVTDKEVEAATKKYAENLRLIADITGEDAKKKMEETEQATKQLLFTKKMTEMGYNMEDVNEAMSHLSKQSQKDIIDMVGFGAVTNETGAMMRAQVPALKAHENAIFDSIKSHKFSAQTVLDSAAKHSEGIKQGVMANNGLLRAFAQNADGLGDLNDAMIDARNLSLKQTKQSIEEGRAGLKQKDAQDDLTKSTVKAEIAAQDMKVKLQELMDVPIAEFAEVSKRMLQEVSDMLDELGLSKKSKTTKADIATQKENETKYKENLANTQAGFGQEQLQRAPYETDEAYRNRIIELAKGLPKHDKGGEIAAGKIGIAGENGPELIGGPSSVLSTASTGKLLDTINAMKLQAGNLTGDDGMDKTVVNSPALQAEIAKQLQGLSQTITDSAVNTKGPSSVLSNATVESLVTAIDAMREAKGTRFGENDFQASVSMNVGRMDVIKDRMKGFEGFDVNQLEEEFKKRPEYAPIQKVKDQWDAEERGDNSSAEATAHLAEIARLMKQNVEHTSRVAANTN